MLKILSTVLRPLLLVKANHCSHFLPPSLSLFLPPSFAHSSFHFIYVTFLSLFCLELIGFSDFKDWCLMSVLGICPQISQMLLSHVQSPPLFWNIEIANPTQSMISIICVSQHLFPIFWPLCSTFQGFREFFFRYIFQLINFFTFFLLYLFPYIIQNSFAQRLKT